MSEEFHCQMPVASPPRERCKDQCPFCADWGGVATLPQLNWCETTAPVEFIDEQWTHISLSDGQVLLARLSPNNVPVKVCRLAENPIWKRE